MRNKMSDALEDKKNFKKELQQLGLLLTTDDALHGFSLIIQYSRIPLNPTTSSQLLITL